MELKPAKRKKFSAPANSPFVPRPSRPFFEAVFNESCCVVKNYEDISTLYKMGFYGKGSLSKSEPVFNQRSDDFPDVIYEQQWQNRRKLAKNSDNDSYSNEKQDTAQISLERFMKNIDQPTSDNWKDLKDSKNDESSSSIFVPDWKLLDPIISDCGELHEMVHQVLQTGQLRKSKLSGGVTQMVVVSANGPHLNTYMPPPLETLQLSLEEAYFLSGALERLIVFDTNEKQMSSLEMWQKFQDAQKSFLKKYVVYYWFRSRGWVVRSGLKYGGDFLLYEKGPDFCHSTYLVHVLDEDSQLNWEDLALMQRLVETFKKDILFCTVIKPTDLKDDDLKQPDVISKFLVREMICRRWIPSQQRISISK